MADLTAPKIRLLRFGPYELDVRAGELRKHGIRIKLREQPVRILLMLAEHPGEVVLRDEIRMRLWPNNTIVEFDHGINAAVQKLRDALGESADNPRYVETVARRGYRFLGEVEKIGEPQPERAPDAPPADSTVAEAVDTQDLTGRTISHYRILDELGSGGMGLVYRAEDLKLGRTVALKFLPCPIGEAPESVIRRFEQEARAASALNHPNICTIHGLEECAGQPMIVMELVEGDTLAQRLTKGPLPLERVVGVAIQIAAAMAEAHRKGIVHHDLKPADIVLSKSGAKVLDFGLAKIGQAVGTESGAILGTLHYLSPEQAQGQDVDARSDIFSFGLVLYEMLTGQRAFDGENPAAVIAAIREREAPSAAKIAPAALDLVLRRCLEKDPDDRWQSARDLWFALTAISQNGNQDRRRPGLSGSRLALAAAAVLIVGALALGFWHFRDTPNTEHTLRYALGLPGIDAVQSFAISPDGHMVVIAAMQGKNQLWLRRMDALQPEPIPFTDDAKYPFWSPDSRYIGFFAQSKLRKVAAGGGPAQTLCDALDSSGGSWNRDDIILFSGTLNQVLIRQVPAAGGVPIDVTRTKGSYRYPVFLPDGRHFLYLVWGETPETNGVYVSSLEGREKRRILPDMSSVVFAPPSPHSRTSVGHILFVRENTLMAQPFDAGAVQVAGDVFPVAEDVSLTTSSTHARVTVSDDGVLIYARGPADETNQIVWYDRAGTLLGPVAGSGAVRYPSLAPDGKTVAFQRIRGSVGDLWLRDLSRETDIRFTSDDSANIAPFWSPNGDRIVFASNRKNGVYNLYQRAATGTGQDELLLETGHNKFSSQWSHDGRFVVYTEGRQTTDIWVLPVDGRVSAAENARKAIPFLRTEFNEAFGQLSADSHWMAYASDESGRSEVYVRPFPAGEGQWKISIDGGAQPRWRGDGKELFFRATDGKIMVAPLTPVTGAKPSLEPGAPQPLFAAHMTRSGGVWVYQYDVTADGKRFLVNTSSVDGAPPLNVVVNWLAGVKK